jgi:hypothetical protein
VTFILTVTGADTLWMLADRQITYSDGRPPRDDAMKIVTLTTADGKALIGYSGLGETVGGMEPSAWLSNVLRGPDRPLESALARVAGAMNREFKAHVKPFDSPTHTFLTSAFVHGEARRYESTLTLDRNRNEWTLRFVRHMSPWPPFGFAGSGGAYLMRYRQRHRDAIRRALDMIRAFDAGRVKPMDVAKSLAALNYDVSRNVSNVGSRCFVIWQPKDGGGMHEAFNGIGRDANGPALPSIDGGMDVKAIVEAIAGAMEPHTKAVQKALREKQPPPKLDDNTRRRMDEALARVPIRPDEKLK